ncbi:MAG: hypothetical protein D6820_00350 [Lentisphaerae bacterium]|nr:MAG: hypothetical protein D6820_00350 [Lentisphaerota bacterium]
MDVIWLIFMLAAFQPVVRQQLLRNARQRLLGKLEHKRNSRVIVLIHRQETMSFFGFPLVRYIDINDAEEVLRACELTDPEVPIDLILHTPGGLVLASLQIARALAKHPGKVTVFVPHYAMSGGTLIALAANEIVMSPHAVLGPVDPQLGQYPAASLLEVVKEKTPRHVDDQTLLYADMAKKAIAQMEAAVEDLLKRNYPPEKSHELASLLVRGTWTHDFPISAEIARELGLNVNTQIPREVLELMALYPQPVRHQNNVEYLPEYRRSAEGTKSTSFFS